MPFINRTLEDDKKAEFLKHILNCTSCYDEFQIYYTLQIMDKEPDGSYDMKRILERAIQDELKLIYRKRLCFILQKGVFFLAELCIVLAVLFGLESCL